MNRFLRVVFLGIAGLLILYAVLFAVYYHALGQSLWRTKLLWLAMAMAAFFGWAGWKFSLRARFQIFLLLFTLFLIEAFLQAAGWLGVLPGVSTKLKAPYARIYWSTEGHGNSVRNRLGWNYPEFDLEAPLRIAFIGDSQVDALEVHRTRNQAAVLHGLLKGQSPEWSVLGLGCHGTSPAFSIEMLEYAQRHFQPQEAIVVVSLGSDVTETSPTLNSIPPDRYIYYEVGPSSELRLIPASAKPLREFRTGLEFSHRSVVFNLPVILNSHCMTLQLANAIRDTLATRRRQAAIAAHAGALGDAEQAAFARVGFNPQPFAVEPDVEVRRTMQVLMGELQRCQEICASHGMRLRLVLLPSFPQVFYDGQRGREWTSRVGKYDYLKPERELAAFARSNSIPVLPIGEYIQSRKLDVEEIRSLYLSHGVGHLSEKGHRFCAEAIFENFYVKTASK